MRRISRLPSEAASRNISACSAQAISQVGWRLMVASSANTSRPPAPAACGDIARALATKPAISPEVEVFASPSADVTSPDLSVDGSRDNQPSLGCDRLNLGDLFRKRQCPLLRLRFCGLGLVPDGHVRRHRAGVQHLWRADL